MGEMADFINDDSPGDYDGPERDDPLGFPNENCAVGGVPPPAQKTVAVGKPSRAEQIKGILARVRDEVKDDAAFVDAWKEVVTDTKVMFRGKQRLMGDIISLIMGTLEIPTDPNTMDIRRKQVDIGNLLQEITTQLAFAEVGVKMFGERKKDLLARGKNQKSSKDLIEAQLAQADDEFRMTRGIWLSAELNHKFWVTMRTCCTDTLDRLEQIYYTLAAESRVNGR